MSLIGGYGFLFMMENPIKIDDLEVHPVGNLHNG
jgi:hypothetical protein